MPILSPAYPHRNTARAVSRATLRRLQAELCRGASQLAALQPDFDEAKLFDALSTLCTPPSFAAECDVCVELAFSADSGLSLEQGANFVESRLRELIADLDKLQLLAAPHRPAQQADELSRRLLVGVSSAQGVAVLHGVVSSEVGRFIRRCEAGLLRAHPTTARSFSTTHTLIKCDGVR